MIKSLEQFSEELLEECQNGTSTSNVIDKISKYISYLRKKDEEELIKMLPDTINEDEDVYKKATILTIKRLYENN